jgi:hypothetical protein
MASQRFGITDTRITEKIAGLMAGGKAEVRAVMRKAESGKRKEGVWVYGEERRYDHNSKKGSRL